MKNQISKNNSSRGLLGDIRKMIEESRSSVAVSVNAALTMLYWRIGKRIREDVLKGKRAEYGKEIVVSLSRQLVLEYGNSFSEKNLRRMIQFAEVFPSEQIELLELNQSGIHVAEYLTVLPPREILQEKLHQAIELSRERLSGGQNE